MSMESTLYFNTYPFLLANLVICLNCHYHYTVEISNVLCLAPSSDGYFIFLSSLEMVII